MVLAVAAADESILQCYVDVKVGRLGDFGRTAPEVVPDPVETGEFVVAMSVRRRGCTTGQRVAQEGASNPVDRKDCSMLRWTLQWTPRLESLPATRDCFPLPVSAMFRSTCQDCPPVHGEQSHCDARSGNPCPSRLPSSTQTTDYPYCLQRLPYPNWEPAAVATRAVHLGSRISDEDPPQKRPIAVRSQPDEKV